MIRKKTFLSLFFLAILLALSNSCIVVGYKSGLKSVPTRFHDRIIRNGLAIEKLNCDSNIYIVSETQVKQYLCQQDSAILYTWIPYCPGTECVSPKMFESYCKTHGFTPVCIMTCVCDESFTIFDGEKMPNLFINIEQYGTDIVWKYKTQFIKNLTGLTDPTPKFYVFKYGKFDSAEDSLP